MKKIKREQITIESNDLKHLVWDECVIPDFKFIEKIQTDFDGEKGYVEYDIIIQRISDAKFFKTTGSDWGKGDVDIHKNFTEVFREEKVTYIYI